MVSIIYGAVLVSYSTKAIFGSLKYMQSRL